MKFNESERKSIRRYIDFKNEKAKIIYNNILESLKSLFVIVIGIPLAGVFFLAIIGLLQYLKYFPIAWIIGSIILIFWYGCILHDLIIPYTKINIKKVPKIEE